MYIVEKLQTETKKTIVFRIISKENQVLTFKCTSLLIHIRGRAMVLHEWAGLTDHGHTENLW